MPQTLQDFLGAATQKAVVGLAEALLRIPEDKRAWSPEGKARTALDLVAECAILNGYTTTIIQTQIWPVDKFEGYTREKNEAAALEWGKLSLLLQKNTQKVVATIQAVPDDVLTVEVRMPWGSQTLGELIAYPYWNMSYHTGQINYMASMLGCLD